MDKPPPACRDADDGRTRKPRRARQRKQSSNRDKRSDSAPISARKNPKTVVPFTGPNLFCLSVIWCLGR